jgi:hypothetical protein
MTPSPLQLESSFLLHTEVKAAEKIPADAGQTIKTRIRIGRSPENELEWNVTLGVTFGRNGKIVDAPYHGDVKCAFSSTPTTPPKSVNPSCKSPEPASPTA